jgi:tRNA(Phe) wybutosine-synthesizing methylase Tyw3
MSNVAGDRVFESAKRTILFKLKEDLDRSPKGSIDEPALPIVNYINGLKDFVTTSSCSGRIAVFAYSVDAPVHISGPESIETQVSAAAANASSDTDNHSTLDERAPSSKGRGKWVFVTHGPSGISEVDMQRALAQCWGDSEAILKLEPFILHVQCRSIEAARCLLAVAVESGFRESGITLGTTGKIIAAVRSTSGSLEVPLREEGITIVSADYQRRLARICERRFTDVHTRRSKFFECLQRTFPAPAALRVAPFSDTNGVACSHCGALFASRNKMFSGHLIHAADGRKVCPASSTSATIHGSKAAAATNGDAEGGDTRAPIEPGVGRTQVNPLSVQPLPACTNCGSSFGSRNKLFKHVASCIHRPASADLCSPRRPHFLAPPLPLSPHDIRIATTAETHARAVLQKLKARKETNRLVSAEIALTWQLDSAHSSMVHRYGHSMVAFCCEPTQVHQDVLVVFGGYSGTGTHRRTNDVVVRWNGKWKAMEEMKESALPSPRTRHSANVIRFADSRSCMLVFGGHNGLLHPLNDVWWLQLQLTGDAELATVRGVWRPASVQNPEDAPSPRWAHAATTVRHVNLPAEFAAVCPSAITGDCLVVVGGRDGSTSFNDTYFLVPVSGPEEHDLPLLRWVRLPGAVPMPARFGHAVATVPGPAGEAVVLHGGYAAPFRFDGSTGSEYTSANILSDMWMLNVSELRWVLIQTSIQLQPRMSHNIVWLSGVDIMRPAEPLLLIFGGECADPSSNHAEVCLLSTANRSSPSVRSFQLPDNSAYGGRLVSHDEDAAIADRVHTALLFNPATGVSNNQIAWPLRAAISATLHGDIVTLFCVGGGGVAFAFGSHFSASFSCSVSVSYLRKAFENIRDNEATPPNVLAVEAVDAEAFKRTLQSCGYLDVQRVCRRSTVAGHLFVLVPFLPEALTVFEGSRPVTHDLTNILEALRLNRARLAHADLNAAKHRPDAHGNSGHLFGIRLQIVALLESHGCDPSSVGMCLDDRVFGLPSTVEFAGGVLMLPSRALTHPLLVNHMPLILPMFCKAFRCTRIARRAEIAADGARSSGVTMLITNHNAAAFNLPEKLVPCKLAPLPSEAAAMLARIDSECEGWVKIKESNVVYHLDITRVMFSPGNASEKARMAAINATGETVVDLFAGIGYFTVPLLVRAKASMLHACEWNSDAITCLAMNLAANHVDASRYRLWPGDNRSMLTSEVIGTADRVLLGLIPSSEYAWPIAVRMLKPCGGRLHIHMNKADHELVEWVHYVVRAITSLASELGYRWEVSVEHLQRVKSYAPHVWHVVADVCCSVAGAAL